MKILGLSTSPRIGGNTDLLLDQTLKGAADQGAEIEKISVNKLQIKPCQECNACYKTGRCVIKDDFQIIYNNLFKCDRLIFATPIYFMAMCAQAKIVVDRCQCLWAKKYILKQPFLPDKPEFDRRGAVISVGGTKGERLFECLKQSFKYFFDVLDMEYSNTLGFRRIDAKGDILKHSTAMQEAYTLGEKIAQP